MDDEEIKKLASHAILIQTMVAQAIEARRHRPEMVWLASNAAEAEANANLFAKTQLPVTDPERKRNLIRAFDRVKKARETPHG